MRKLIGVLQIIAILMVYGSLFGAMIIYDGFTKTLAEKAA